MHKGLEGAAAGAPDRARDEFWHFEHAGWERAALHYASSWLGLTRMFAGPLLDAVRPDPQSRLLDIACGPGCISEAAQSRVAKATGVDFSPQMIALARTKNPRLDFRVADAHHLPFKDSSFDVVTMNFGVLHMSRPERVFVEARRVLSPGGRFGFTVWATPEINPLMRVVADAVDAHADPAVGVPEGPDSFLYAEQSVCSTALERAGFESGSLTFGTTSVVWLIPSADFLFEAELHGAVRTSALLARQSPRITAAIRAAIHEALGEYSIPGAYEIPAVAHVIAVQRA